VIGLTTALRLHQNGFQATIIARHGPKDRDIDYTSPWAGAHYRPIPDIDRIGRFEADLAIASHGIFKTISSTDESSGVEFVEGIEYFDTPSAAYLQLGGRYSKIDEFRVLNDSDLPEGVKFGVSYRTWCLDSPVYLTWLEQQLVSGGVRFVQHNLVSLMDAFSLVDDNKVSIVINCSGIGFSDPNSYPTRGIIRSGFSLTIGQTVLVANPCDRTITRQHADGSWTFIIPRPLNGGTVIGGTKQPNDWNAEVDESTREGILDRASELYPPIITNNLPPNEGGFTVISDIVGRRPTRHGGPRIEKEELGDKTVIHAYGLGGRGFETSWGVAEEVLKLVKNAGVALD
jgi:glycine/D-amino acid oxidase-like deaminating enzyme